MYQTIGSKTEAPRAVGYKRGKLQEDGGPTSRQMKARVTYEELDFKKKLSKWKKSELEAYLSHHKIAKSGNKHELFRCVSNHMHTTTTDFRFIVLLIYVGRRHLYSLVVCMANEQLHV